MDKFQLMMDAKTLGMIARNMSALADPNDWNTRSRVARIRSMILARHNAKNVNDCLRRIAAEMLRVG